jgi:hypothetical protein
MKALLFALLLLPLALFGRGLAWDANPAADHVEFYTVYDVTGGARVVVDTTPTTTLALPAGPGERTYVVTATNELDEESEDSLPVTSLPLPSAPKGLRIVISAAVTVEVTPIP